MFLVRRLVKDVLGRLELGDLLIEIFEDCLVAGASLERGTQGGLRKCLQLRVGRGISCRLRGARLGPQQVRASC